MLRRMKPTAQAPYANSVGFGVIVAFTACQLLYMLGVYGITWAGVSLHAPWDPVPAVVCRGRSRSTLRASCLHIGPVDQCASAWTTPTW